MLAADGISGQLTGMDEDVLSSFSRAPLQCDSEDPWMEGCGILVTRLSNLEESAPTSSGSLGNK